MPVEMKRPFPPGMAGGSYGEDEDGEIDPKAHELLVDGINNMTGAHYIREVTRTEPSLKRSEFGLSKASTKDKVRLKDLGKFFKNTAKHSDAVKQLEKLKRRQPLLKPLEKPAADRLAREAGYERAQKKLDKWEPLVQATAVAPQIVFPLRYGSMAVHNEPPKKLSDYRVKSKLMEEMEQLEKEYAGSGDDEEAASDGEGRRYKLTAAEMRRKQLDRLRHKQLESYRILKGRRQKKIKSKTFHRLLKKDKLKEQIKTFEELKEKDPEEALRQLDRIEKQRYQERATLRHKNTGTWAKNLQVRAKYNTDVRRELADQLAIGKELTMKRLQQDGSSSESDGEVETYNARSGDNPWTNRQMGDYEQEVSQQRKLVSSYRKYWEERNRVLALKEQQEENGKDDTAEGGSAENDGAFPTKTSKRTKKGRKKTKDTVRMASGSWDVEDVEDAPLDGPPEKVSKSRANTKTNPQAKKQENATGTVEELFEEAEELIQHALVDKLDRVKRRAMEEPNQMQENATPLLNGDQTDETEESKGDKRLNDPTDLSFKQKPRLGDADEELHESIGRDGMTIDMANERALAMNSLNMGVSRVRAEINPNQVVKMKPKHLLTALPNTITSGELSDDSDEDDDHRRLTIAEAFEDDDIVADFARERKSDRENHMPKALMDLSLPGWGFWAGDGAKPPPRRQQKRILFKPPKELPRRDDGRDKVIINESALVNPKLSKHLVNEVPFPYVTVKDYEASLRAPLGRTFVPETAHTTMIEPRVVTKQGAVIEPMRKIMLFDNQKGIRRRAPQRADKQAIAAYDKFLDKFEKRKIPPKEN